MKNITHFGDGSENHPADPAKRTAVDSAYPLVARPNPRLQARPSPAAEWERKSVAAFKRQIAENRAITEIKRKLAADVWAVQRELNWLARR